MRITCFIIFTFYSLFANSQENPLTSKAEIKTVSVSEESLLKKAKALRDKKPKESIKLANKVLELADINNNQSVGAQAHTLLGKLEKKSNRIDQSIKHFLQASFIYKSLGDDKNQIKSSIDDAAILFTAKRYSEAHMVVDKILPLAQQYGNDLLLAKVLIVKGDGYYQQQLYNGAIEYFTHALEYLSTSDKAIQKKRAEVYEKLAQSYKRLENKEKTASFYKKTVDIYTAINNAKLMARTLNALAEAERNLGNYAVALDYSMRGLELHKHIDDPAGYAKASMGVGIIYRYIGRYEKSLKHIHEAYLYYKKVHDNNGIAKTSNQTGLIYTRLKQFDSAKIFYQLTIDQPEDKIESKELAAALREMAVIDLNLRDYESAMQLAKKAYKIYQTENDRLKSSLATRIIGRIYQAQNNNEQAAAFYRTSLSIAKEIGSEIYQIKAQTLLANTLIETNIDEAIGLLKDALALSTKINAKRLTLYAYKELRKAEKHRGNIAESLSYAEKEIYLFSVIKNEEENNELVLAKAKLYSHKLEMELERLKEKTKLDQLALTKKNSEIEIAEQATLISELKLIKNRYASVALASLLAICVLVAILLYRKFIDSKKRNRELDYLAARDPLTNCYNRRILFDFMNRDFLNLDKFNEYSIILADIDHFKAVNDTFGHSIGDVVLSQVAQTLQNYVSENDIVARFGGEEFCIILPETSKEKALDIAQAIRQKIKDTPCAEVSITCSFGVSSIQFNAKTPTELIDQADLALFKSKSDGRNKVTLWEDKLEKNNVSNKVVIVY